MVNRERVVIHVILVFSLLLMPAISSAIEVEAITKPSADISISFVKGGNIAEVMAKEGDVVEVGDVLARQDDEVEKLQLLQWEAKAKNKTKIEAIRAEIAQRKKDLEKYRWAKTQGAVTDWEIDHAKLEILTARINLRQAELDFKQTQLQRDELRAQVKHLTIKSPIAGVVEEVLIEQGESAQPLHPVIRLVKIKPLWIDVPLPISYAGNIMKGQTVKVKPSDTENNLDIVAEEAEVIHISAVADAASDTMRVRVEYPNLQNRPAGERFSVIFE